MSKGVQRISSGSPMEARIGYCRALRVADRVLVSGTAPVWSDHSVDPNAGPQTSRILEMILAALEEVGASASDVVRTRIFITDPADADAIVDAHGAVFADIRPTSTMVVVSALMDPRWKVEIEAEAVIQSAS